MKRPSFSARIRSLIDIVMPKNNTEAVHSDEEDEELHLDKNNDEHEDESEVDNKRESHDDFDEHNESHQPDEHSEDNHPPHHDDDDEDDEHHAHVPSVNGHDQLFNSVVQDHDEFEDLEVPVPSVSTASPDVSKMRRKLPNLQRMSSKLDTDLFSMIGGSSSGSGTGLRDSREQSLASTRFVPDDHFEPDEYLDNENERQGRSKHLFDDE